MTNKICQLALLAVIWEAALSSAAAQAVPIEPGSWTLAVLPDTQVYAQSFPRHFHAQTQWIADYADSHNVRYVLHEGDIVNNNNVPQWDNALASMNVLNGVVPYALAPGNHDYGPGGNAANRESYFNQAEYFGPGSFYAQQPSIGGFYEAGRTDNSFHTFSAGGRNWLVLALEFGPRDEVVAWANQVVEAHPDHQAMLVTHAYMYFDETRYDWAAHGASQSWNPHSYGVANLDGGVNDGEQLWDKLVSKHDNFRLVFNGHVLDDGTGFLSSTGEAGNVVHQMLANYQMKSQGGLGDMRLLEFKADGRTVEVRTFSPVLGRYDTSFDQQFTLDMREVHPPLVPPPPQLIPHAVAANLVAVGPTDPAANTVNAVLIPQGAAPGVETLQINRGDYQVAINGSGLTFQQGVLLASITQHERPDFSGRRATVEVGRSSYGDGLLSLSIMEAGNAGDNEVNFNTAVAWFQFQAGWQAAHVNANGSITPGAANGIEPSMVTRVGQGRYRVDLGVDSRTDGMLFTIANNNDNVVVQTGPFHNGQGWDIRVADNASNFAPTGEDRDFSFVYLPYDTKGLIGGLYDAAEESHVASAGKFTMTKRATGEYGLTIPGQSPETGMLIMSVADRASVGGSIGPNDNMLTYEATPGGSFLIHSRDLPSLGAEDSDFVWAFISFDDPLTPEAIPEPTSAALLAAGGLIVLGTRIPLRKPARGNL